jgi:hypothetical protein
MLGLSLVVSMSSVIRVMSAPLAAPPAQITVPDQVGGEGFLADANSDPIRPDGTYSVTCNYCLNP